MWLIINNLIGFYLSKQKKIPQWILKVQSPTFLDKPLTDEPNILTEIKTEYGFFSQ